jgi:hypothetical protein
MSERWLIVGPDSVLGEHSVGTGFSRTVVDEACPSHKAFIVDPDAIRTTNLVTGESFSLRDRYLA